jgi:hypothetical protein
MMRRHLLLQFRRLAALSTLQLHLLVRRIRGLIF